MIISPAHSAGSFATLTATRRPSSGRSGRRFLSIRATSANEASSVAPGPPLTLLVADNVARSLEIVAWLTFSASPMRDMVPTADKVGPAELPRRARYSVRTSPPSHSGSHVGDGCSALDNRARTQRSSGSHGAWDGWSGLDCYPAGPWREDVASKSGRARISGYYEAVRPSPAHRYFRPRGWSRLRLFPWHHRPAPFWAGHAASVIIARWWRSRQSMTKTLSDPTASVRLKTIGD